MSLDFRPTVRIAGLEVDGITLAGATIRYGADHPYAQPEPASAYMQLITSDALASASQEYPGFSFGAGIPSGFTDEYVDDYGGTVPQLNVGAPVSILVETPTGFVDPYVDEYLAGFTATRFTGNITSLDYTPGAIAVTAVTPVESLTRMSITPASWPLEDEVARVNRIAAAAGITVLVEGSSSATLLGTKADASSATVYELLAKVADDCDGLVYGDRLGRIVYRTRTAPPRQSGHIVDLGPGATLLSTLRMTTEAGTIANVVTVKAGDQVTVVEDADSIARFGRRERSWSTELDTGSRQTFAARRLSRYSTPRWHMPAAEVVLDLVKTAGGSYPTNVASVLELDLDDQVALPQLLPASPVPSYVSRLLGYDEVLDPHSWRLTFSLDPHGWSLLDQADAPWVPPPLGDSKTPQLEHTGPGTFRIRNYLADLVYTGTIVAGSGTVTITGDTVTLSDANARASITTNADGGRPGFAERKAYTSRTEDHGSWQTTTTTVDNSYPARYEVTDIIGDPAQGPNKDQCPPGWWPINAGSPDARCWTQTGRWVCDNGGTLTDSGLASVYCRKIDTTTSSVWVPNVVTIRDSTPAGYQDAHGEWSRVT
jgi:hypothetical protein